MFQKYTLIFLGLMNSCCTRNTQLPPVITMMENSLLIFTNISSIITHRDTLYVYEMNFFAINIFLMPKFKKHKTGIFLTISSSNSD